MSNILEKAKSIEEYVINFRRDLHENTFHTMRNSRLMKIT